MAAQANEISAPLSHESELIQATINALPRSLNDEQRRHLQAFVPAYFENLTLVELSELSAEDLAGITVSHWRLANARTGSEPLHRVFNPGFDTQGWHSLHTA